MRWLQWVIPEFQYISGGEDYENISFVKFTLILLKLSIYFSMKL